MHVNWIDLVIIAVVMYQMYDGWGRGFTQLFANLGSFLASLWFAVRFHGVVGNFFVQKFGIPSMWTDVLGYIGVALVSQLVIEEALIVGISRLPQKFLASKANRWLGSALSAVNAIIIVSFFLLLILSLPLRGTIKQDIRNSSVATWLVVLSERYGGSIQSSFDEIAKDAVRFLTVQPGSKEQIPIDVPKQGLSLSVDSVAESKMVQLVNKERTERGLGALTIDTAIIGVARGKSRDMFERRYFSHYDPDGKNAADRLDEAGVAFTVVGENLAYAPDLSSAHQGLMNSEGHKANILEPRFHHIGIGVIDGGIYGKMFTQIFTD